jgi:hypothetical protein
VLSSLKVYEDSDLEALGSHITSLPLLGQGENPASELGSVESLDFIKTCLQSCLKNDAGLHAMCSQPEQTPLPKRVLFINEFNVRLMESDDRSGDYCALSYSWGVQPSSYKSTKSNYQQMKAEIDLQELPVLLQDAISITRRLGYVYLWIDAICIIQDDHSGEQTLSSHQACQCPITTHISQTGSKKLLKWVSTIRMLE